jgi:ArsR family transcriptional regulator
MSSIPEPYEVSPEERARFEALAADDDVSAVVDTFKAITDPLRVHVLRMLAERDLCVCVLVDVLDVEYSKLSYHLKILREAGLVRNERDGNYSEYGLTDRGRKLVDIVADVEDEA